MTLSSLWENSRIRDNNCFYNSKTLSDIFFRLDPGGVSRPSWGASCLISEVNLTNSCVDLTPFDDQVKKSFPLS